MRLHLNKARIVTRDNQLSIVSDMARSCYFLELGYRLDYSVRFAGVDLYASPRSYGISIRACLAEMECDDGSIRLDEDGGLSQ